MSLELHVFPISPRAFKVLMTAHHLGIDYDLRIVDLTKGEQKTPEFTALNPNQRMPVLEEDGFSLWESNAIVEYLASKKEGWLPGNARDRLALTKWLYWDSNHWDPTCAIFIFERIIKPFFNRGETSASEIARGEEQFNRLASVLNGQLEKHRFIMGDTLTIADLSIGAPLTVADRAGFPLEAYPAIRRWHAELKTLPAWQQTIAIGEMPRAA
ncbi:MAG TPA: glutathione S-transferase family protein [Rhizomicrobium sp.]|jgi:glutathione S-transferase